MNNGQREEWSGIQEKFGNLLSFSCLQDDWNIGCVNSVIWSVSIKLSVLGLNLLPSML